MKGLGMAWQVQLLIAGTVIGGGYLAWTNKFPPFDEGGLVDQLFKYLPKHKGRGSTPASQEDSGDSFSDSGGSGGGGLDPDSLRAARSPNPTGSTVLPNGNTFNPLLMGMQIPPTGMQQNGIMQTSRASDPTSGEMNVYDNYVKALQMQFGQGNRANIGSSGGPPNVIGDPNLGTTPVPAGLFPQNMNPPGYPPQGGMPSQFGRPSMPPGNPFLPNPTQYPGAVQPGPYPSAPPMQAPPQPIPQSPYAPYPPPNAFGGGSPYGFGGGSNVNMGGGYPPMGNPYGGGYPPMMGGGSNFGFATRARGAPFFTNVAEIYGIDVGDISPGLNGIRVGDLIKLSGNEREIFPNGVDRYNKTKFEQDLSNYINRLLKKMQGKTSKIKANALKQILSSHGGNVFAGAGFATPDKAAYMQFSGGNSLQPYIKRKNSGGQDPTFRMKLGNQR